MVALCRSGRQRDALVAYDAYVKHLHAEHAVGPGDRPVRRERQIWERDPDLGAAGGRQNQASAGRDTVR